METLQVPAPCPASAARLLALTPLSHMPPTITHTMRVVACARTARPRSVPRSRRRPIGLALHTDHT
eukprot:6723823-Prymnesium_polylepis.1